MGRICFFGVRHHFSLRGSRCNLTVEHVTQLIFILNLVKQMLGSNQLLLIPVPEEIHSAMAKY